MSLRTRLLAAMALVAVVLVAVAAVITVTTHDHLLRQVDDRLMALGAVGSPPLPDIGRGRPAADTNTTDTNTADTNTADTNTTGTNTTGEAGRGEPTPPAECPHWYPGGSRLSDIYEGVICDGELHDLALPSGIDAGPALDADQLAVPRGRGAQRLVTAKSANGTTTYRTLIVDRAEGGSWVRAKPLDDVNETVRRLVTLQAVATTGIIALLGLATWWVQRLGIRPIKQMTAAATRIAGGELDVAIPDAQPGTESGALSTALNAMLTQIRGALAARAASERRLRQFVADASHELRTPLTTIRGYAELHRHGALEDREARTDAMRRTEEEAARMGRLVDDMLTLAKYDEGRPLRLAPVELFDLARAVVRDVELTSGRTVSCTGAAITVVADADQLQQALLNLLNNAVVHTDAPAAISVTVGTADSAPTTARIVIDDEGPGVAPELADRLTERFFRVDASRSRRRGGSGLGLAIVAEIVAAHDGTLTIASEPGRGTAVTIDLPSEDLRTG